MVLKRFQQQLPIMFICQAYYAMKRKIVHDFIQGFRFIFHDLNCLSSLSYIYVY